MHSSRPSFNPKNFESRWEKLGKTERILWIAQAPKMDPELGILPILKGLSTFQSALRISARKSIGDLISQISNSLSHPEGEKEYQESLRRAAIVGGRLYQLMDPGMGQSDQIFFLQSLMGLGEHGAYFVFKAFLGGIVNGDCIKKLSQAAEPFDTLLLVDQYTMAPPDIRLAHAPLFKNILSMVSQRSVVLDFYAHLFDLDRGSDPFWGNIAFALRDPEQIQKQELQSISPDEKIKGLKALSMVGGRMDLEILKGIVENEEIKKVREVAYEIVERSGGGWPDLFEPIFHRVIHSTAGEALAAFRALAALKTMPFHKLVDRIRKKRSDLIPSIHMEIARLSRLAFWVIQDLALHGDLYKEAYFELHLACVLGVMENWPERLVSLVGQGKDADIFSKKVDLLLKKESRSIEAPFRQALDKMSQRKKEASKLPSLLSGSGKRRFVALRKHPHHEPLYFQDQWVAGEEFPFARISATSFHFDGSIFKECNLSRLVLKNARFAQAIFHGVNLSGARLERVNFDGAIFINVQAPKAVFKDCSFQGACFFKCNFHGADFSHALFIGGRICKSIFTDVNLTGACLSHALISGVSFVSARLDYSDFSFVRARFSHFPAFSRQQIRSRGMDENARNYRLGLTDLPRIDKAGIAELTQMIFLEFIQFGESRFIDQNKLSLLMAFDLFTPSQADLFQIIPLLLHGNIPLPGEPKQGEPPPCGIAQYLPSDHALATLSRVMGSGRKGMGKSSKPAIEGLFTMGSVGSIAQNTHSDIDYWVCINERTLTRNDLESFKQKLRRLENFAREEFKTSVTFFVVDVLRARNYDFGTSNQESSGTAQARLLKEEFYRTMIHVAGKLPLWAVLPTPVGLNYYNVIKERINTVVRSHRYLDLGDIHAIPVNEYFGASIWQMFKWLKSPFKSVIKMGLVEKYIHAYGKEPLLCNQYKDQWMNSGNYLKVVENDSYIILMDTLLNYYQSIGDKAARELLLICFFLKLGIADEAQLNKTTFGFRRILLDRCLGGWGGGIQMLLELGRFKDWRYVNILRLSSAIERYMVEKYTLVKERFDRQSKRLMISEGDRDALEHKIGTMFLEKTGKIKRNLLVSRGDKLFSMLRLKHLPRVKARDEWLLSHKRSVSEGRGQDDLMKAESIEEIIAWLIHNDLYSNHSMMTLLPNASHVTHHEIQKLMEKMHGYFSALGEQGVQFAELRQSEPRMVGLFVNFNFYSPRQRSRVTDYCAVSLNSWGEMFYYQSDFGKFFGSLDAAKREILSRLDLGVFPKNVLFHFPKGAPRQGAS